MSDELDLDSIESTEEFDSPFEQDQEVAEAAEDTLDEEEAHKGYLRQQDYTKKTQALAEERRELRARLQEAQDAIAFVQWVQANPQAAKALRAVANGGGYDPDDEYVDPSDIKVKQAETAAQRALAAVEGLKMESQMEKAIAHFGLAADTDDLFEYMRENGISKPMTAARLMAAEAAEQAKTARKTAITQAKQGALPHVEVGRRPTTGPRPKVDYSKVSYEDLINEALADLG